MALSIMGETARVVSWTVGLDGDHWSHYGKTASLILNEGGLGSHVKFLLECLISAMYWASSLGYREVVRLLILRKQLV